MKRIFKLTPLLVLFSYITVQIGLWHLDNTPPTQVIGPQPVIVAHPGQLVKVEIPVVRDLSRPCSLLFSRYMVDNSGVYYDIMATRFLSHQGWVDIEKAAPHEIKFSMDVPKNIPLGKAVVTTQKAFMCNPLQYIWPLDVEIKVTLQIEP